MADRPGFSPDEIEGLIPPGASGASAKTESEKREITMTTDVDAKVLEMNIGDGPDLGR